MLEYTGKVTLFDRVVVRFLYGVLTFATCSLVLLSISFFSDGEYSTPLFLWKALFGISVFMFLLGCFNLDKLALNINVYMEWAIKNPTLETIRTCRNYCDAP